jgi:hypothetical protein
MKRVVSTVRSALFGWASRWSGLPPGPAQPIGSEVGTQASEFAARFVKTFR